MTDWEPVIGLEVHVQLGTVSKAFSSAAAGFGAAPNEQTDPTVLGLPGALPVFNQGALRAALRLGIAMGCKIRERSRFARKHYFYPDLPKGYQISQYDEPLCEGGELSFWSDGVSERVKLTRIHLEEDAGKSTHHRKGYTTIDLNRAGVPLCEVVTEPVIHSARVAADYMRALRQLVRYLDISSGDMEKGHLRCDANVSLRPRGSETLGTRAELKNINSFRFVEQAIEHEIARQAQLLDSGGTVVQETRLWDADAGVSHTMRSKEEAEDYRYMPDPDLPPLVVSPEEIAETENALPELPAAKINRYQETLELPLEDALQLAQEPELSKYYDAALAGKKKASVAKLTANWVLSELRAVLNEADVGADDSPIAPGALGGLVKLIETGTISGKIAKKVFDIMRETGDAAETIVEREGLVQISDEGPIREVAQRLVEENPGQRDQYRAGKTKLLGFFVGRVMKETQGRANPEVVNRILRELLDEK